MDQLERSGNDGERIGIGLTGTRERPRVEIAEPAIACAIARLVVAPDKEHRSGIECRLHLTEEIGIPDIPVVIPWTAGASDVARSARRFAVVVIAGHHNQLRACSRGVGCDFGDRPRVWIVASLINGWRS